MGKGVKEESERVVGESVKARDCSKARILVY